MSTGAGSEHGVFPAAVVTFPNRAVLTFLCTAVLTTRPERTRQAPIPTLTALGNEVLGMTDRVLDNQIRTDRKNNGE